MSWISSNQFSKLSFLIICGRLDWLFPALLTFFSFLKYYIFPFFQTELDVNLVFLGDNKAQYNEGRTLRIIGKTDNKVQLAKLFIQREFIEKWSSKYNNNLTDLDRRRMDNKGNEWGSFVEDSQMEVLVPQNIAKIMIRIKV